MIESFSFLNMEGKGGAVLKQSILYSPFFSVSTILVGRGVEGPVEVTLNGVVKFIPTTIQKNARS